MNTMQTTDLADVVKARRKDIGEQAECEGCGTTLEECKRLAASNTDPTAPPWFGCCAMGSALGPCSHRPNVRLLNALLKEIEAGAVRTVEDIRAEREAEARRRAEQRAANTPPGHGRPLGYADRFRQSEWWLTKDSGWIRIADMATSHRHNAVRFLERRAATVADKAAWSDMISLGDAPDDVVGSAMTEAEDRRRDPLAWLTSTPLYRALAHDMEMAARPRADDTAPTADHPFHGLGTTCSMPIEGTGDDFIRCGLATDEHPLAGR